MARKARQRANGDGTIITFRKKSKIIGYAAEITVGWKDGKRQKVRSARCKERPEAEAALVRLRKQHAHGLNLLEGTDLFSEYLAEWLAGVSLRRRPRTVETYRWAIARHINPDLGSTEVQAIRTPMLRRLLARLAEKQLAAKSIGVVRTVLRQALMQAVDDELFEYNPADRAKPPEVKKRMVGKALTVDQVAALLAAAIGDPLEIALRLCFSFGLRRGEVCGLRWKDIDLGRGVISINGTLGLINGQGLIWGETKTENGRRAFQLPASLIAALTWHQTRQEALRLQMGADWAALPNDEAAYVFVSARTGGPVNPARLYDAFKKACKQAGLEGYRLHDLRHSAASFLHAQRAPKKTISTFMGHANTRITDDIYTHLFQDELNDAAHQIELGLEAAIARQKKGTGIEL